MTTEIAIINKMGIALAADSAASLSGGSNKVFSANKLFMFSKHAPIGIMIYQNAAFMGFPWETLIKTIRKKLYTSPESHSETLTEDAEAFMNELASMISSEDQITHWSKAFASEIRNQFDKQKSKEIKTINDFMNILLDHIDTFDDVDDPYTPAQIKPFNEHIYTKFISHMSDYGIKTRVSKKLILSVFAKIINKQWDFYHTGVVIAGFGKHDLLPSMHETTVDGVFSGKLRTWGKRSIELTSTDSLGYVVPFADSNTIQSYMQGIKPQIMKNAEKKLAAITRDTERQVAAIPHLTDAEKENLLRGLLKPAVDFSQEITKRSEATNYETRAMIAHLPPAELAEMAHSLVKLSCLQKRVSFERETVGGDVDVAVITKGDGLIWIQRKHYFDKDLNLQFTQNYLSK